LRDADVIALQEMDAAGTQRIATALGMSYVYYPQVWPGDRPRFRQRLCHGGHRGRCEDRVPLGLSGFGAHRDRATILVGGTALACNSVHLGTKVEIGPGARRDQVRAIVAERRLRPGGCGAT